MTDEKLLTVRELTVLLSCSPITIRRLVDGGDIPAPLDTGRRERQWRRADFDDYFGADPDNDRPLWTAEKVGERLGVGLARVYQLAKDGALPAVRLGSRTMRWREADVRRYAGSEDPSEPKGDQQSDARISATERNQGVEATSDRPEPGTQRVKWRGQVVRDHEGDGRWYPILKGWEGFETQAEADAVFTAAIGHLLDAIPAPQGDAPPTEAVPDTRPDPAEAPQPDIGPGLAREADQWQAARGNGPANAPNGNGSPRHEAQWAGTPGAVDADLTGAVKWYRAEKGYGFIEPDDGSRDVFVHVATLERLGISTLMDGEPVRFSAADNHKGRQAVSITRLSG